MYVTLSRETEQSIDKSRIIALWAEIWTLNHPNTKLERQPVKRDVPCLYCRLDGAITKTSHKFSCWLQCLKTSDFWHVKSADISETYNTSTFRVDVNIVETGDSKLRSFCRDSRLPDRNADLGHPPSKMEELTTIQIITLAETFQPLRDLTDFRSSSEAGKNNAWEFKAWRVQKKGTRIFYVNNHSTKSFMM